MLEASKAEGDGGELALAWPCSPDRHRAVPVAGERGITPEPPPLPGLSHLLPRHRLRARRCQTEWEEPLGKEQDELCCQAPAMYLRSEKGRDSACHESNSTFCNGACGWRPEHVHGAQGRNTACPPLSKIYSWGLVENQPRCRVLRGTAGDNVWWCRAREATSQEGGRQWEASGKLSGKTTICWWLRNIHFSTHYFFSKMLIFVQNPLNMKPQVDVHIATMGLEHTNLCFPSP